ncbi:MAG: hypothetical protein A2511_17515 [Deltaproteobacteria bacterium RIFOXYD12_FULL_50_9]|nr:MAG: hypothetical protein A2511_17515 [Deltaproteobacteria bacterium RIFOXYD12_FULL_50_9]
MKKGFSIAIAGNCQARPLAQVIKSLVPDVYISGIAIVHLLSDAQQDEYTKIFESADLILAQRVTDNYPCTFVRNKELRKKYEDRLLVWPNLYYAGYNPELIYLRGEARKPLAGPFGDYHNKTFVEAWRRGLSVDEAVRLHNDDDYNREAYGEIPKKSLEELRKREAETDVRIVDWIAERLWRQRLFFTFNHPALVLIQELADRLIRAVGLEYAHPAKEAAVLREPLGNFSCPVNPWVAKTFGCTFGEFDVIRGSSVMGIEGNQVILKQGKSQIYENRQIVEEYFKIYDMCGKYLDI